MKLEAEWVPVALSADIEAGTSAGFLVEGFEIVVWRDNRGQAHVWEDRCPHRGMRMSFGFVRGDHIACLYHGWQYDTGGQCRLIPAHPGLEVPQTIKVPTYQSEERYGIVWATASRDAALPDFTSESNFSPLRSLYVDCAAADVVAHLDEAGWAASGNSGVLRLDDDRLLIAIQSLSDERTALHLVVLGSATADATRLKRHANWAARLRFDLEHRQSATVQAA